MIVGIAGKVDAMRQCEGKKRKKCVHESTSGSCERISQKSGLDVPV